MLLSLWAWHAAWEQHLALAWRFHWSAACQTRCRVHSPQEQRSLASMACSTRCAAVGNVFMQQQRHQQHTPAAAACGDTCTELPSCPYVATAAFANMYQQHNAVTPKHAGHAGRHQHRPDQFQASQDCKMRQLERSCAASPPMFITANNAHMLILCWHVVQQR